MALSPEQFLELLYVRKLPSIYRTYDCDVDYCLKRYLQALVDGGFYPCIQDAEKSLGNNDPKRVSDELLPYFCKSFGLPYFNDIDPKYQRKFLANIGEITKRRGTYSCVHFIIKVLTGMDAVVTFNNNTNILDIVLLVGNLEEVQDIDTSVKVIEKYIKTQIPYYVIPRVIYDVTIQVIPSKSYHASTISQFKGYSLIGHIDYTKDPYWNVSDSGDIIWNSTVDSSVDWG